MENPAQPALRPVETVPRARPRPCLRGHIGTIPTHVEVGAVTRVCSKKATKRMTPTRPPLDVWSQIVPILICSYPNLWCHRATKTRPSTTPQFIFWITPRSRALPISRAKPPNAQPLHDPSYTIQFPLRNMSAEKACERGAKVLPRPR